MTISELKTGILLTTNTNTNLNVHAFATTHLSLSLCYNQKLQYTEEEKKKDKV